MFRINHRWNVYIKFAWSYGTVIWELVELACQFHGVLCFEVLVFVCCIRAHLG